jgi:hypothetical protein
MAGYDPVPDVGTPATAPDVYQRVGTNPWAGVAHLGESISKVGDFYDESAVDDAFNQLQKKGTSLLYGDGTLGPDGQPKPGYMGLNGKAALEGRLGVQQSLDDQITSLTDGLGNDALKQAFKTRAASYSTGFFGQVGSHSQTQSKVWYGAVNDATATNQLDMIAANTGFDPKVFLNATAALTDARMKTAQLAGASPGDEVWNATLAGAKQEATKAQALAINTNDPEKALSFIQSNKTILGTEYDNLYATVKAGAIATAGDNLGTQALTDHAATGAPMVRVPSQPGDPAWLDTYYGNVKAQESAGDPNAKSKTSSALGWFQITNGTARGIEQAHPELGLHGNWRTDPEQATRAYAALTKDNARYLTQNRVPITPGNLYLAAFFGPAGAAHVYDQSASTPMEQAVSEQVLNANSWLRGKTVGDIKAWAARHAGKGIDPSLGGAGGVAAVQPAQQPAQADVGHPDAVGQAPVAVPPPQEAVAPPPDLTAGSTPAGTASAKASNNHNILDADDTELVAKYGVDGARQVKQHAIAVATQQLSALQVAADQTVAQKRAANETAANGYVTKMLTGGNIFALLPQIANDQNLTSETKLSLTNALTAHSDRTVEGATAAYGDGYWDAFKRVILPPGDPNRLADPVEILRMAAPGPNGEAPAITLDGVAKLQGELTTAKKSTDSSAVQKAKASLEAYAKSKLSNQEDPNPALGSPGHKDPIGERAFNATFIPKFESAFDAAVARGDDVFATFLTKENVDKMMQGIRDPQEVAMQKILGGVPEYQGPPAPEGVDVEAWQTIAQHAPATFIGQDGNPTINWPGILERLVKNPTPDAMWHFDQNFGKGNGFTAKDVLDALGVEPGAAPVPAEPPVVDANQALRDSLPMPAGS